MEITEQALSKLKEETKEYYNSLKEVYCPYFNASVKFTSGGFQHIFYKNASKNKERDKSSQIIRLKLFKLAQKLLRDSKTVQEYFCNNEFVIIKMNKRKEKMMKAVYYWGFIGIIDGKKIKVIVRQVGSGDKKFWSIIPNWITRKSHENNTIITYRGDLKSD
ncbi:MAG: hypothetical protein UT33_C0013G0023 [Candidatus Peregrinibacteria bacterium GW2011_GWC2_39_14]|nr:MAG: hypothetical protein US92_C0007G0075 [Candidatus Peregrinibacteria bacterium GW2011_GWA2_38_36]KKR05171.1 MAG: hypothetical protein UT33_C0013G0023 [Candidatus Peregrinibacteria bacterium GW2011_GWC2_39_14]